MSMENAILAHAAAVEKLAEAIKGLSGGWAPVQLVAGAGEVIKGTMEVADNVAKAETKTAKGKAEPGNEKAEPGNEKATEETTTAAASDAGAASSDAGADDDGEVLDYSKDVKPVLLAAIRKQRKAEVQELIASFGVAKGDLVPAEKLGELLAGAKKLAA